MDNDNPTLRDVTNRRAAIREERQQIEVRLRQIGAEDQELAVAERVLAKLVKVPPPLPWVTDPAGPASQGVLTGLAGPTGPAPLPPLPYSQPKELTIEEVISFVLDLSQEPWLTANDIQEQAKDVGKEIPMSSLSPTLSIMKNKGTIARDGLKVALSDRIKTKTTTE
jgi:hypothetical protein